MKQTNPPASVPLPSRRAAPTDSYTLSLHDALPIYLLFQLKFHSHELSHERIRRTHLIRSQQQSHQKEQRSEEHTSELQSRPHLVCRLVVEKKKEAGMATPQMSLKYKDPGSGSAGAM